VSEAITSEKYLAKAERALQGARLLADSGEVEGACNRAYYAMYDAAHAALLHEAPVDYKVTKTHSALIAAFGVHLVLTNKLPRELGRSLNEVEQIRLLADYTGADIKPEQASWAVNQAEVFVAAIRDFLF
jgi:uncharacterized protein (UPF0332 family)